ncbi:Cobalt-dependent inorganic pyrophosphatase [bioreactor metagenome]|uniref:Cobalt-dependent inorganic pyrophosphatase n=1 Tax=bioreactor metagenome TaxID=1076179 RepID=A0A644YCE3_9ZZZZ
MTDFKEFHIAGHDLGISQITCTDSQHMLARKDELVQALHQLRTDKHYDLAALMLTDVLQEGSRLFFAGDEQTIQQAFNCKTENGSTFLPHVMSRKKQVIPALSALWG